MALGRASRRGRIRRAPWAHRLRTRTDACARR
jgi:hypothetical protein